ncbi:serpin-Z2A-like isoform X3 [Euphorbia lathyris]|uniref:serpin-Z2A-like isoform X3 n=1 Tax=Euphorbia lathyris TaxID=212925 RepID=UPI003313DBFD
MFERIQKAGYPVTTCLPSRMHPEICWCPYSHFYDGKLLNGQKRTLKQLLHFLQSDGISHLNAQTSILMELASTGYTGDSGPMIRLVNGIWADLLFPLKHSFKQLAEDVYEAKAESADFLNKGERVRNEINSWAREALKGNIDELLPYGFFDKDEIKLVLANAVYFKGLWVGGGFDASNTKDEDFHLLNGETVRVPFMKRSDDYYFYGSLEGFKLLKMPYKISQLVRKRYAMYIFLPDKNDGLQELVEKLYVDPRFFRDNCKLKAVKLRELWLPKFKYEYALNACESMKELGLDLPFDDEKAEIKEMVETLDLEGVNVSKVIQKSYIEVNEGGTIATVVDALRFSAGFSNDYFTTFHPSFVADHPFLFMIKEDDSGIVVSIGATLNPLS